MLLEIPGKDIFCEGIPVKQKKRSRTNKPKPPTKLRFCETRPFVVKLLGRRLDEYLAEQKRLESGIEEVTPEEPATGSGKVYHLPHVPVRIDKATEEKDD